MGEILCASELTLGSTWMLKVLLFKLAFRSVAIGRLCLFKRRWLARCSLELLFISLLIRVIALRPRVMLCRRGGRKEASGKHLSFKITEVVPSSPATRCSSKLIQASLLMFRTFQ